MKMPIASAVPNAGELELTLKSAACQVAFSRLFISGGSVIHGAMSTGLIGWPLLLFQVKKSFNMLAWNVRNSVPDPGCPSGMLLRGNPIAFASASPCHPMCLFIKFINVGSVSNWVMIIRIECCADFSLFGYRCLPKLLFVSMCRPHVERKS